MFNLSFAHCVEKFLERGEQRFLAMIFFRSVGLFVCLDSDTHDNLRMNSHRKFVLVLKCCLLQTTLFVKKNTCMKKFFLLFSSISKLE